MQRTPQFEEFVAPAMAYRSLGRLFTGIVIGFLVYMIGSSLIVIFLTGPLVGIYPRLSEFDRAFDEFARGAEPGHLALLLATFIAMAAGAAVAALNHWRSPKSLFGTTPLFWTNLLKSLGLVLAVNMALLIGSWVLGFTDYIRQYPVSLWAIQLLWVIPLLFVQITAEEMVFRGYLQQQLAARFRSSFFWMFLPSVVFGIAHFNPQVEFTLAATVVFLTGFIGFIMADLTRITGNLGAAMGLHFGTNFTSLTLVGIPDELSAAALFLVPYGMDRPDVLLPLLFFDAGIFVAIWILLRRWLV